MMGKYDRKLNLEEVVAELVERLWRAQNHFPGSEITDDLMMRSAQLAQETHRGDGEPFNTGVDGE